MKLQVFSSLDLETEVLRHSMEGTADRTIVSTAFRVPLKNIVLMNMLKPISPREFLIDRGQFTNSQGVSVMVLQDDSVHLSCDYPDVRRREGVTLEIANLYATVDEMINCLNVRSKIEFNAFTPLDMLQKYLAGTMKVFCMVEKNRRAIALAFHMVKESLIATNEDSSWSHRVDEDLRFGDDYISYTEAYFNV